ncbi:uncharacterized protein LOC133729407 isoform X1 [Rosa rugosa]|uniref:uncharacterized protein LOC133729407 isoform X1 n=1 Tax=Rosa rugosa TaxID=74645 RepID=UPI002B40A27B|nr:uncharacterized protein LOC133729407 isoform X1 [Rosa rugosa]XP_062012909.1 uncharacterized protein LOC133729407 isoform X1 [Rosa rugosa]XP_062012910.1 uncharacterized protein LOC133729407 isoform X1 [Rosa rugosa]
MAEALVNVLLERLATIALDKVEQELELVVGVKKEVKNLTRSLESIQAVLEDAQQRQVMGASVKRWLNELNDVSYEMDDVLDEWITTVLKRQMEKQARQGANGVVTTQKKDILTQRILGYGVRRGKLYYLDLTETGKKQKHLLGQANQINRVENVKEAVWLWHRRLGHLSFSYLKKLQPHLFSVVSDLDFHCDICELAKSHRISYSPSLNKSHVPFM